MNYWLLKSEPTCYSIEALAKEKTKTTHWDGVRNYQARNMMRDQMKKNDMAFFYHSNAAETGIAGIVKITKAGYPDFTQFDPEADHYDPKSDPDNPRWFMVDVKFEKKFNRVITLGELRENPRLKTMQILQKGNRLSVTPVTEKEWQAILAMV